MTQIQKYIRRDKYNLIRKDIYSKIMTFKRYSYFYKIDLNYGWMKRC